MTDVPPPPQPRKSDAPRSPMSDRNGAKRSDPPPSILSVKLATAPDSDIPLQTMRRREREELAQKRIGATIKGWRLARLLGVGPFTAAYESFRGASDSGDHVALRVMLGEAAKHEHARSVFLRSAYAANRFSHPRILPIVGDGLDDEGAPFVLRSWIDAESLEVVASREPLAESHVLRIAEQILDALEMAHAHGIVHGAISPRNILVTPRGSIRLVDFATPPGGGQRDAEEDIPALRRINPFVAPERCIDPPAPTREACDIYSVAACMYFAIAQSAPRGETKTGAELAKTIARPLREVAPTVGEYFARVVDHGLSLEPERRYESAYAMLGDVRRVLAGRKPKLGDAHKPVPSGSFSMSSSAPSSVRKQPIARVEGVTASRARVQKRSEWKGNAVLILAIALLVGIATFVVVREKVEEERGGADKPAVAAPPK